MLGTELATFHAHLQALNRPVASLLLPGIGSDRVGEVYGSSVPDSVEQWFAWANGVAGRAGQIQDEVNVIPGYNPLSIDEAVRLARDYSGDSTLGENWMPLLGSAGGDFYAAVWALGEEAVVAGVLIGEPTEVEFSSIEQMVGVFNKCFDGGAYFVDEQGRLAMSPERYDEIYDEAVG